MESYCKIKSVDCVIEIGGGSTSSEPHNTIIRKNGWQLPWDPRQILFLTMYFTSTITSFVILIPLLPPQHQLICSVWLAAFFLLQLVSYILTSSTDPSDEMEQEYVFIDRKYGDERINIMRVRGDYCERCNKWVNGFHCRWMNTCIGHRNLWCYHSCLTSLFMGAVVLLIISFSVLSAYFIQPWLQGCGIYSQFTNNRIGIFNHLPVEAQTLVILFVTIALVILYLATLGLTAYTLDMHRCCIKIVKSFFTTYSPEEKWVGNDNILLKDRACSRKIMVLKPSRTISTFHLQNPLVNTNVTDLPPVSC